MLKIQKQHSHSELGHFCNYCEQHFHETLVITYYEEGVAEGKDLFEICEGCAVKFCNELLNIVVSCENAEKQGDKCLGYQQSRLDDEPTEKCKACKDNIFYEE